MNFNENESRNVIKEIKEILNSTSIKEKYEGLLNRELILPCNYKLLYKKFENLDIIIGEIRKSKGILSFNNIQKAMKDKNIIFTLEDFQRILFITPHFFIYRWEKSLNNIKNTQSDLIIDIPSNIEQRLKVLHILFFTIYSNFYLKL